MKEYPFARLHKDDELLFMLRRYFIDTFNSQTVFIITATFYNVSVVELPINQVSMSGTFSIEYATREEINNFVQKIRTIVDGKFADDYTPNYDLIKSFIELNTLFNSKISL